MAAFVFTNARVEINAVDHSDHVKEVRLEFTADSPETTAMGATYRQRIGGGLKDARVSLVFNDDIADNGVNEKMFDLLGTLTAIKVRENNAAIGTGNPEYQFDAIMTTLGTGGAVSEIANLTAEFTGAGAVTRAVA